MSNYPALKKENIKMLEKVREVIAEQLSIDPSTITEETKFKEDLGADSLDLFEVVMALEDSYGIEIPQEDLEGLKTVGAVIEYLKEKYFVEEYSEPHYIIKY